MGGGKKQGIAVGSWTQEQKNAFRCATIKNYLKLDPNAMPVSEKKRDPDKRKTPKEGKTPQSGRRGGKRNLVILGTGE